MALSSEAFTISPKATWYRTWIVFIAIISAISLWVSPYYMSFLNSSKNFAIIENTLNCICLLDIILSFFVAYKDKNTNLTVTDKSKIAIHYATRKHLLLDIMSVLPAEPFYMLLHTKTIFAIFAVFRLWRLKKLLECLTKIEENPEFFILARCFKLIYLFLLNVHIGGCTFYLIASMHPDAQRSWTKSIPNFFKWKLRKRYITSLYLAMTTFSTVGYGDLHAESQGEMIFSIVYMIWNIGFLAYIMQHFDKIIQRITDKHKEENEDSGTYKRENKEELYKQNQHIEGFSSGKDSPAKVPLPIGGHHSDVEETSKDNGKERSCSVPSKKSDPGKWVKQLSSHLITMAPEDTVDFMLDDKGNSLFLPVKDIQELCARTQEELCLTIPRVWVLYLERRCAQLGRSDVYGFIDPFHIQGENDPAGSRSRMTKKLLEDNKHCYLAPYLRNNHWQLIVIEPRKKNVVFLCSLGKKPDEDIVKIVNSVLQLVERFWKSDRSSMEHSRMSKTAFFLRVWLLRYDTHVENCIRWYS